MTNANFWGRACMRLRSPFSPKSPRPSANALIQGEGKIVKSFPAGGRPPDLDSPTSASQEGASADTPGPVLDAVGSFVRGWDESKAYCVRLPSLAEQNLRYVCTKVDGHDVLKLTELYRSLVKRRCRQLRYHQVFDEGIPWEQFQGWVAFATRHDPRCARTQSDWFGIFEAAGLIEITRAGRTNSKHSRRLWVIMPGVDKANEPAEGWAAVRDKTGAAGKDRRRKEKSDHFCPEVGKILQTSNPKICTDKAKSLQNRDSSKSPVPPTTTAVFKNLEASPPIKSDQPDAGQGPSAGKGEDQPPVSPAPEAETLPTGTRQDVPPTPQAVWDALLAFIRRVGCHGADKEAAFKKIVGPWWPHLHIFTDGIGLPYFGMMDGQELAEMMPYVLNRLRANQADCLAQARATSEPVGRPPIPIYAGSGQGASRHQQTAMPRRRLTPGQRAAFKVCYQVFDRALVNSSGGLIRQIGDAKLGDELLMEKALHAANKKAKQPSSGPAYLLGMCRRSS